MASGCAYVDLSVDRFSDLSSRIRAQRLRHLTSGSDPLASRSFFDTNVVSTRSFLVSTSTTTVAILIPGPLVPSYLLRRRCLLDASGWTTE